MSARLGRPQLRMAIALAVGLVLVVALWFWVRDSSLVAVRTVDVSGIYGPQAAQVRAALETAGRSMTTLHVRQDALDTAVKPFALVKRLEVSTNFPHTLRIHVVTNVAVAAVVTGGQRIPVTAEGTLLRDVPASASRGRPHSPTSRCSAPRRPRCAGTSPASARRPPTG